MRKVFSANHAKWGTVTKQLMCVKMGVIVAEIPANVYSPNGRTAMNVIAFSCQMRVTVIILLMAFAITLNVALNAEKPFTQ